MVFKTFITSHRTQYSKPINQSSKCEDIPLILMFAVRCSLLTLSCGDDDFDNVSNDDNTQMLFTKQWNYLQGLLVSYMEATCWLLGILWHGGWNLRYTKMLNTSFLSLFEQSFRIHVVARTWFQLNSTLTIFIYVIPCLRLWYQQTCSDISIQRNEKLNRRKIGFEMLFPSPVFSPWKMNLSNIVAMLHMLLFV